MKPLATAILVIGPPGWIKPAKPIFPKPPRREFWRPARVIPDRQKLVRDIAVFRKSSANEVRELKAAGRLAFDRGLYR